MKTYDCTGKKKVWDDSAYRAWKSNREMWDEIGEAKQIIRVYKILNLIKKEPCQD